MNKQPEALRLIQHMDDEWQEDWDGKAIRAELRRLHALNQELLEALKDAKANAGNPEQVYQITRAAIAKATGEAV